VTPERKVESALDNWFRGEGWTLDISGGDHIANQFYDDESDEGYEISLNLTELAKSIVTEIS
jgi:hypothetical protein